MARRSAVSAYHNKSLMTARSVAVERRSAMSHFLGHVQQQLAVILVRLLPNRRRSLFRNLASLPLLPQRSSAEDLRVRRFGSSGGLSPS